MQDLSLASLMDKWASDWVYETDLRLAHKSGFTVQFRADGPRDTAIGDIVSGSTAGYVQLVGEWAQEPHAAELLHFRPLQQATLLYRKRPADTLGAPRRLAESNEQGSGVSD